MPPETIEPGADGRPQCPCPHTPGQPIDGHDAPGVEHVAAVVALEVGIVELGPPATRPGLAARDDAIASLELSLDEASSEPDGVGLAALVAQQRGRTLHATAKRVLDLDGIDRGAHGDGRPRFELAQVPKRRDLAQILVVAWEVDKQVTDRGDAHAAAVAPQRGRPR